MLSLHVSLVNLALKCYASRTDYANTVFQTTKHVFDKLSISRCDDLSFCWFLLS